MPIFKQVRLFKTSQSLALSEQCYGLLVVLRGHVMIKTGDEKQLLCTQAFACLPSDQPYAIEVPKTKRAEYVFIEYVIQPENSDWSLSGLLSAYSEIKIRYMLDEMLRNWNTGSSASEEERAAQQFRERLMLERILFIFCYESMMRNQPKPAVQSIEETISYINQHYMLPLSLSTLASRAGISEAHYTVLFKKHTGLTMTQFVRRTRIEKAKRLFQQTNLSAKEIAQKVGYSDYFYFSRTFKQEVGCSPAAYRKEVLKI